MTLGSNRGQSHAQCAKVTRRQVPMNSGISGRWDRNRTCTLRFWRPNPACRVVSRAIARCRSAPRSLSSDAADCRRVSSVTGADTGATHKQSGTLVSFGLLRGAGQAGSHVGVKVRMTDTACRARIGTDADNKARVRVCLPPDLLREGRGDADGMLVSAQASGEDWSAAASSA